MNWRNLITVLICVRVKKCPHPAPPKVETLQSENLLGANRRGWVWGRGFPAGKQYCYLPLHVHSNRQQQAHFSTAPFGHALNFKSRIFHHATCLFEKSRETTTPPPIPPPHSSNPSSLVPAGSTTVHCSYQLKFLLAFECCARLKMSTLLKANALSVLKRQRIQLSTVDCWWRCDGKVLEKFSGRCLILMEFVYLAEWKVNS